MNETMENRLKRLKMRSWRRGTKEMDLVLGHWADARLDGLTEDQLSTYDDLLNENDQDLMSWILGQSAAPAHLQDLLIEITAFAENRLRLG